LLIGFGAPIGCAQLIVAPSLQAALDPDQAEGCGTYAERATGRFKPEL
jgi:hypothetical protein